MTTVYTASNGAIVADLTALRAIPSTDLPVSGFVVLLVASENNWFKYNPALTSGDATPSDNPSIGRWLRIGRDKLTANRTYFVRTDGNDANTGLINNSGGAFLTIPKAIDVASSLDSTIYTPTIQLADGTYSAGSSYFNLKSFIGSAPITIQGNVSDASAVILTGTNSDGVVQAYNVRGLYSFRYVTFTNTNNGHAINCQNSVIHHGNCVLGALGSGWGFVCANNGLITNALNNAGYPLSISGSMSGYFLLFGAAIVEFVNATITAVGTPTFSSSGINCNSLSYVNTYNMVVSGSANGIRYSVSSNAVIGSSGVALLGSSAGSSSSGGLFL